MPNQNQSPPTAPEPVEVPQSFFGFKTGGAEAAVLDRLGSPSETAQWAPSKAQYWYDSIIDWMFANPGGSIKECALALGRNSVTISLIVRSDLFKARYAARRVRFNEELDHRLVGKLAQVAEAALDSTIEVLRTKGDKIPLPILNEVAKGAMDRLGYGPSAAPSPASVVIHNSNSAQAASATEPVSSPALARAREHLRTLQVVEEVEPQHDPLRLPSGEG